MKKHLIVLLSIVFILSAATAQSIQSKLDLPARTKAQMKKFYRNKRVLVTGGCGFIGSHIAKKLVDLGAHVTIIDNLSTGNIENIKGFINRSTFHNKNISDLQACLDATKGQDLIFHLAGCFSVPLSLDDPVLCHKSNVDGTLNLLEAARLNKVKRFIFSSSSATYGPTEERSSETSPQNPISPYGFSKLIGEQLCKQYAISFGLDTVILRYFNVYGQGQNPEGTYPAVVARFSSQLQQNKPITIYGDGLQTRDFVPVEQVVDANLLMGMLDSSKVRGETFNIASGTSISLLQLVDQLRVKFPRSTSTIVFGPERSSAEVRNTCAEVSKYTSLLASL